jgi:poly-gamma-glutamate synthase PgsB/CapB
MYVFVVLLTIIIIFSILGVIEFTLHQRRIYSVPIRIHVNGTRGKSSVTRLIGAGLREGSIKTITKVTGTDPRLILEDGTEAKIYRKAEPNIIEQLSIVKCVAERKAQAIVMECMALQPQYQWITEQKMIHATIGVLTNVRLDHVDVMGHTLPEVADALGKTIPKNRVFFTAEKQTNKYFKDLSDKKNSIQHVSDSGSVTTDEMRGFRYIEHKENVALALDVCEHLGVKRETALHGMHKANPDTGALRKYPVKMFNKAINFYNAFAANDPQSTLIIWKKIKDEVGFCEDKIVLLNTRHDRMDRARQLAEMLGKNLNDEFDFLILIGQSTDVVKDLSISNGVARNKIINLGWTEPPSIFETILSYTKRESSVVAIGNMGGMGTKVAAFFEHRSIGNG